MNEFRQKCAEPSTVPGCTCVHRNVQRLPPEKQNTRARQSAGVRKATTLAEADANSERIGMTTGDALNFSASDTQVIQLAIVERSKLTHGLLISGPLLDGLANTHFDDSLSLQALM
jgi:hypothetical protein